MELHALNQPCHLSLSLPCHCLVMSKKNPENLNKSFNKHYISSENISVSLKTALFSGKSYLRTICLHLLRADGNRPGAAAPVGPFRSGTPMSATSTPVGTEQLQ